MPNKWVRSPNLNRGGKIKKTNIKIRSYQITSEGVFTGFILHEEWLECLESCWEDLLEEDSRTESVSEEELATLNPGVNFLYREVFNYCSSNEEWIKMMKENGLIPSNKHSLDSQDEEE